MNCLAKYPDNLDMRIEVFGADIWGTAIIHSGGLCRCKEKNQEMIETVKF